MNNTITKYLSDMELLRWRACAQNPSNNWSSTAVLEMLETIATLRRQLGEAKGMAAGVPSDLRSEEAALLIKLRNADSLLPVTALDESEAEIAFRLLYMGLLHMYYRDGAVTIMMLDWGTAALTQWGEDNANP